MITVASSSQPTSSDTIGDENSDADSVEEDETAAEKDEEDDKYVRKNVSFQPDTFEEEFRPFIEQHFDNVFSHAVRTSLRNERKRREDGVDTVELKLIRNNVKKTVELVESLNEELTDIQHETDTLKLGVGQEQRFAGAASHNPPEASGPTNLQDVTNILRDADSALSMGTIASRTEMELTELHQTIGQLMDNGFIDAVKGDDGIKYVKNTTSFAQ